MEILQLATFQEGDAGHALPALSPDPPDLSEIAKTGTTKIATSFLKTQLFSKNIILCQQNYFSCQRLWWLKEYCNSAYYNIVVEKSYFKSHTKEKNMKMSQSKLRTSSKQGQDKHKTSPPPPTSYVATSLHKNCIKILSKVYQDWVKTSSKWRQNNLRRISKELQKSPRPHTSLRRASLRRYGKFPKKFF